MTSTTFSRSILRSAGCLVAAALCASTAAAQVLPSQAAYDAVFAARSAMLAAHLTDDLGPRAERWDSLRAAGVDPRTAGGRIDLNEAAFLVRTGLDPETGDDVFRYEAEAPFSGGMFYIHDMMTAFLHARDGLTPATQAAVRESLRRQPLYRGDTENHWLLYYTGLYLAAQTWPGEPGTAWFNGRSSDENLAEASEYIAHWMDIATTIGQGEFDSPTYLIVYLGPLLSLHTHADDPGLKEQSRKMLDWILADYAVDYLKGLYAGGHSRDYPYDAVLPSKAPSVGWGWLFFGDTEPVYRSDGLLAAWSPYRLPVVINNVAVDRSVPYTQFERKRVRHVMRYGEEKNPPVYKTTYMTSDYALGSLQGGILQPIQQHTWDVTYAADTVNTTIFTLHPYYSGYELAMFFPEEIEWLSDEVDRYHIVYTDPNKWNSSSPYERTFQHENAIIVLYDLAPDARHGHVDGFFPKSLERREVDPSGWIFSEGGDTYVAVYPLQPYEWIEEDVNWRLRSHERRNGFVVEVGRAADDGSFEAFKAKILANELDASAFEAEARVDYTTSRGAHMSFTYPDERRLNGAPYELTDLPLFQGPYLNGDGGSQRLVVSHGGMTHVVDFGR